MTVCRPVRLEEIICNSNLTLNAWPLCWSAVLKCGLRTQEWVRILGSWSFESVSEYVLRLLGQLSEHSWQQEHTLKVETGKKACFWQLCRSHARCWPILAMEGFRIIVLQECWVSLLRSGHLMMAPHDSKFLCLMLTSGWVHFAGRTMPRSLFGSVVTTSWYSAYLKVVVPWDPRRHQT